MGLFGLFGRKKAQRKVQGKRKASKSNSLGERMDRLTRKGDLPYGWTHANRAFTEKIRKESDFFFDAYWTSKRKGVLQEYAALKSLIKYIEDVTKLCKRKGECFAYWASCMVANPKQLAEYKERLKRLEADIKRPKK